MNITFEEIKESCADLLFARYDYNDAINYAFKEGVSQTLKRIEEYLKSREKNERSL